MSYAAYKDARYSKSQSVDTPIRGSGWFREGVWDTVISKASVDRTEDGRDVLDITFQDVTGNTHSERWNMRPMGYEWRGFRAAMFPDLACQDAIERSSTRDTAPMLEGLRTTITVELSSGYRIVREGGEYCAVDGGGNPLVQWKSTVEEVRVQCRQQRLFQSLHKITNIEQRGQANESVATFQKRSNRS